MLRAEMEAIPCQTIQEMSNTLNQHGRPMFQGHLQQIWEISRAAV